MAFDTTPQTALADRRPNLSSGETPRFFVQPTPAEDDEVAAGKPRFTLHIAPPRPVAPPGPSTQVVTLQTWEGFVTDIIGDEFHARLSDLTDQQSSDEETVALNLSEVDEDDLELVRVGGVFRWIIGYHQEPFKRRESFSSIVFRRLPAWTAQDLEQAQARGEMLANAFQWE